MEKDMDTVEMNETTEAANTDAATELTLTDEELRTLCAERVCPQCPEKAEMEDQRLRLLADMDNTRKRLERDKDEFRKFATEKVLADLLPVLDNLDLALKHAPTSAECKNFVLGVDMTRKAFLDALSKHALEPVGELGEEFSPEIHEAVGQEERTDMEPGRVANLLNRGYRLNGRLLRPAMVMVSKAPEA
ncbi:nucleotide exchange factor GrpE [Desulfobaculum xiamenense]